MRPHISVNDTDIPLITGDQPVINMMAARFPADVMVEDCEFCYPLSPDKALVIAKNDRFSSGRISETTVAREFNRLIALSAERQVYTAQESNLNDVLSLVGRHAGGWEEPHWLPMAA